MGNCLCWKNITGENITRKNITEKNKCIIIPKKYQE